MSKADNKELEKSIKTMEHWIEYEKENKEKINNANELIEIQETVLKELKRLQEENKELYKKNKRQQGQNKIANDKILAQKGQLKVFNEKFIHRDKIRKEN